MFDEVKQLAFSFDQTETPTETPSGPVEPIRIDAERAAEIVRRFKNGTSQTSLLAMFDVDRDQLLAILSPAMEADRETES